MLEDGALQIPTASATPLRIVQCAGLPPGGASREHPGRLDSHPFVDWSNELLGRSERHELNMPGGQGRPVEGRSLARQIDLGGEWGQAETKPAVDGAFGGPQVGDRLPTSVSSIKQGSHHTRTTPRRLWVGRTAATVTPAAGTLPPGTVS